MTEKFSGNNSSTEAPAPQTERWIPQYDKHGNMVGAMPAVIQSEVGEGVSPEAEPWVAETGDVVTQGRKALDEVTIVDKARTVPTPEELAARYSFDDEEPTDNGATERDVVADGKKTLEGVVSSSTSSRLDEIKARRAEYSFGDEDDEEEQESTPSSQDTAAAHAAAERHRRQRELDEARAEAARFYEEQEGAEQSQDNTADVRPNSTPEKERAYEELFNKVINAAHGKTTVEVFSNGSKVTGDVKGFRAWPTHLGKHSGYGEGPLITPEGGQPDQMYEVISFDHDLNNEVTEDVEVPRMTKNWRGQNVPSKTDFFTERRVLRSEPEMVQGPNGMEPASYFYYVFRSDDRKDSPQYREYKDGSGRLGAHMDIRLKLPKSIALELQELATQDPAAIRILAEKSVTDTVDPRILENWSKPPYEEYDPNADKAKLVTRSTERPDKWVVQPARA